MPKSLFERMGLVESLPDSHSQAADMVIAAAPVESLASVDSIYEQAGLSDLSRSIYRVQELREALPANLAAEDRKSAVLSAIKVFGLTAGEIVDDAARRKAALSSALKAFQGENQSRVAASEAEIADLEARIETLRQEITAVRNSLSGQGAAVESEIKVIDDIVAFVS